MRILVDMDEVLADFLPKACHYHRQLFGSSIQPESITTYDLPGDRKKWDQVFQVPGFFADLDWVDQGAPLYIQQLVDRGHDVRIVSTPAGWESAKDKYAWVHTRFIVTGILEGGVKRNLILTGDKSVVDGDVIVDDCMRHLDHPFAVGIAYDRPWNQEWTGPRARNWFEVYKIVLGLEEQ